MEVEGLFKVSFLQDDEQAAGTEENDANLTLGFVCVAIAVFFFGTNCTFFANTLDQQLIPFCKSFFSRKTGFYAGSRRSSAQSS